MANTPTPTPAPITLVGVTIPVGWTAFYHPSEKKVYGVTEFKNGCSAKTALSIVTKPSEAELMTEITSLGLAYTAPAVKPAAPPTPPKA